MKTLLLSAAVALTAAPALGQMTIERMAPENSVLVVGMPNVEVTRERFQRTSLYELWMSDEMKRMRADAPGDFEERLDELFRELGVDREEISWPTGAMGFALHAVMDEEIGRPKPAMLAFVDYGVKAGPVAALVQAALDRGERDRLIEYEVKDILGREVFEIHFRDDHDPFDDAGVDPFNMMPNPRDMLGGMDVMYYLRDDNVFMLSSDLGSLTETLDRIDGNVRRTLTDREDFQAIMGQIGRDDAYFVVLTRDLMNLVSGMGDEMGMLMFMQPTLKELFGDIRGLGAGVRLDGNDAMVESRWSVYMPAGKRGLTRLVDLPAPRAEVPAFVSPDAVSYSTFNFQFDQVVDVIRTVIQSNPFLAMQAGEIMEIVEGPVQDVLNTLGTRVHSTMSINRPLRADSIVSLTAVEVRDAQQFENLIAEHAPMIGLEPRDFMGQRIYTMEMGGMMGPGMGSFSLGIGGGYVIIGPTTGVEQGLRSIGQADRVPTIAEDETFQRALRALGQRQIVGWSYTNMLELINAFAEVGKLTQEQWMEEMRQEHPEWAEEMERQRRDAEVDDPFADFDFAGLARRYIGPVVGQVRSTDDGFVGSTFLLAPEDDGR